MTDGSPPKQPLPDVVNDLDTGDVILFNRPCMRMSMYGAALCMATKVFHRTRWDHVGVVVCDKDGKQWHVEAQLSGVRVLPLRDRLQRSSSYEIAVRRLQVERTEEMRDAAWAFVQDFQGRPYNRKVLRFVRAALDTPLEEQKGRLHALLRLKRSEVAELAEELDKEELSFFRRATLAAALAEAQAEEERLREQLKTLGRLLVENEADTSSFFCSQLIAALYQTMGVLPTYPAASKYLPHDFSNAQDLLLMRGAWLRRERFLRVQPGEEALLLGGGDEEAIRFRPNQRARRDIAAAMASSRLFRLLDAGDRRALCHSFSRRSFQAGDLLFSQGDAADGVYVLVSGSARELVSQSAGHEARPVRLLQAGAAFGSLDTLFGMPRSSAVRAEQDCVVWFLPRPVLEHLALGNERVAEHVSERLSLSAVLARHPMFRNVDDEAVVDAALDAFTKVTVPAGQLVVDGSDVHNALFVLQEGTCEVVVSADGRNDGMHTVRQLLPGDTIGEVSVLLKSSREASVRAETDCTLWRLDGATHLHLLQRSSRYLRSIFDERAHAQRDGQPAMRMADIKAVLSPFVLPREVLRLAHALLDPEGTGYVLFDDFLAFDLLVNSDATAAEIAVRLAAGAAAAAGSGSARVRRSHYDSLCSRAARRGKSDGDAAELAAFSTALFGVDGSRTVSQLHYLGALSSSSCPAALRGYLDALEVDMELLRDSWQQSGLAGVQVVPRGTAGNVDVVAGDVMAGSGLSAAVAVVVARTVSAPFDRLAILRATRALPHKLGFVEGLRWMLQQAGWRGLLFGNTTNILRSVPFLAIQVACYDAVRSALDDDDSLSLPFESKAMIAGGAAGAVATLATYPLDVMRSRMAVRTVEHGGGGKQPLLPTLAALVRSEGLRAAYRGLTPSLLGSIPHWALCYGMWEVMRPTTYSDAGVNPWPLLTMGTAGAIFARSLVYPIDVLRRRLQVRGSWDNPQLSWQGSVWGVLRPTWRVNGRRTRSLYAGLLPTLLKFGPSVLASYAAGRAMIGLERRWREWRGME